MRKILLIWLILLITKLVHAQNYDYDFTVLPYAVVYKEKEDKGKEQAEGILEEVREIYKVRKDIEACVNYYSRISGIPVWVYYTIMSVESGFNPYAINKNKNGTIDIGIMQINSATARHYGYYDLRELFNPCTNIKVATLKLLDCISTNGWTYGAIGCYHSENINHKLRYIGNFLKHRKKIERLIVRTNYKNF